MRSKRHVVIGAGHAGGRAVEAMRKAGFKGEIILVGAEEHLPYERPPLSKEILQAKPDYSFSYIRPQEYFDEQKIELRLGNTATAIAPMGKSVTLANGETLSYDKLLLTTGGRVRKLPLPGDDLDGVHYLRTLDEGHAIEAALGEGKKLVVIGGGFIGLEVAASARQRGGSVTVLEIADRLMGRGVPHSISQYFLDLHLSNGVDIHLGTGVERIKGDGAVSGVTTSTGEHLDADMVVIGIGIIPETDLAEDAGLKVENGIIVDEFCRTSATDIYAAGDVTSHFSSFAGRHIRLEAWQCAQNMAIAAAKIMCGEEAAYSEVPWMWSDQFDTNLQVAGFPDSWDNIVGRGDAASGNYIGFVLNGGNISGAIALNQPRDLRLARRMMDAGKKYAAGELADEANSMRELSKR
jgi:3-phenylpropionate/trans-cinnamate dioxygenase ferredoxin reductase subunit